MPEKRKEERKGNIEQFPPLKEALKHLADAVKVAEAVVKNVSQAYDDMKNGGVSESPEPFNIEGFETAMIDLKEKIRLSKDAIREFRAMNIDSKSTSSDLDLVLTSISDVEEELTAAIKAVEAIIPTL